MRLTAPLLAVVLSGPLVFIVAAGCDPDGGENTGRACVVVDDCFPGIDPANLSGDVHCLDRVEDGYCTHLCETDADCCAVEGECLTPNPQVCAPFESTGLRMCFLSCEPGDVDDWDDDNAYCQEYGHPDFNCRSTGGGSENRKVCVP